MASTSIDGKESEDAATAPRGTRSIDVDLCHWKMALLSWPSEGAQMIRSSSGLEMFGVTLRGEVMGDDAGETKFRITWLALPFPAAIMLTSDEDDVEAPRDRDGRLGTRLALPSVDVMSLLTRGLSSAMARGDRGVCQAKIPRC